MAKMNFKQLMLEKGEKIGLAVAAGIAILLVVTQLLWPGYGLFAPNPKDHQKKLEGLSTQVSKKMQAEDNLPKGDDRPRERAAVLAIGTAETKEPGLIKGKIKEVNAVKKEVTVEVPKEGKPDIEESRVFVLASDATLQINGKAG